MLNELELDAMRECSLSALPDTGVIVRPAAGGTLNTTTGVHTPAAAAAVYAGVMRVRPPTPTEVEVIFGDREVTKQRYVATLPHDVDPVAIDDRLHLLTSSDDRLVDRWLRVVTVSTGSFSIDRRLGLEVAE